MGRLILLILLIGVAYLVWKAFGPEQWRDGNNPFGVGSQEKRGSQREIKGPDDDEEFLWEIEKNRFKARRAQEAAALEEEERIRRARARYREDEASSSTDEQPDHPGSVSPESPEHPDDSDSK